VVLAEKLVLAFASNSNYTAGLDGNDHKYFLDKAHQDQWSFKYMVKMFDRNHDLKNGKKADNFSDLCFCTHEHCQEYILDCIKMRTKGDHCQKMSVCSGSGYP
jgi:adenine specific DNA methylase Mod